MIRFEDLLEKVRAYAPEADVELLRRAYVFSAFEHRGQVRHSGEPYLIHPLAVAVGIHPVHLGVIVVMTQSFGLLTPPLGMVAMTACAVGGVPMMRIQKLLHIMMIPLLIVIILCALAPWTVLLLPKLLVPKWL